MKHEHVKIAVHDAATPGVEHVPARRLSHGEWQLMRSPLYAMHVASGDVIKVIDDEAGTFEIVRRGGNVGVQVYLGEREVDDAMATTTAASDIARDVEALGGSLEGQTAGLIVYSIPASIGLTTIEKTLEVAVARWSGAQWQYCNVYDPHTGEPLRWWE